ncbi:MAG: tripartite tricarboxylate transporter substrate binding protein, partial [Xanthobacteraceae bacterium]
MFTRRCVLSASVLAFGLDRAGFAQEQSYPDRVIKLIVPFPAGGPTDIMGRLAGQLISSALGQTVVVENRPGAGGTIGSQDVAHANADGYTLLLGGTNTNAINAAIYRNLNYDPIKDFTPIASIAVDSSALVISPSIPAKTIQEFIVYLKANQSKLTCGAVLGIAPHVMVEYFKVVTGTDMVFVPYKGGPALLPDLLTGRIQMTFGAKSFFLPYMQSGKLHPLAVTSDARWTELPDVPTMRECGFANFPAYQWLLVLAPAGTPATVIDKLNAAINDGLKSPAILTQLAKFGTEPRIRSPQELVKL